MPLFLLLMICLIESSFGARRLLWNSLEGVTQYEVLIQEEDGKLLLKKYTTRAELLFDSENIGVFYLKTRGRDVWGEWSEWSERVKFLAIPSKVREESLEYSISRADNMNQRYLKVRYNGREHKLIQHFIYVKNCKNKFVKEEITPGEIKILQGCSEEKMSFYTKSFFVLDGKDRLYSESERFDIYPHRSKPVRSLIRVGERRIDVRKKNSKGDNLTINDSLYMNTELSSILKILKKDSLTALSFSQGNIKGVEDENDFFKFPNLQLKQLSLTFLLSSLWNGLSYGGGLLYQELPVISGDGLISDDSTVSPMLLLSYKKLNRIFGFFHHYYKINLSYIPSLGGETFHSARSSFEYGISRKYLFASVGYSYSYLDNTNYSYDIKKVTTSFGVHFEI